MSYWDKLKARIPWMFITLGLALLGFGRKAARFEEGGGQLPSATVPIILVVIGVGILVYQKFVAKKKQ